MTEINATFNPGKIEVIVGTMFSGKSKMLIERGLRAKEYGDIPVVFFKPSVDTRSTDINSRNGLSVKALIVETGREILYEMEEYDEPMVVIIDEAQFFDQSLIYTVQLLKLKGHNIVLAGLNVDFRGQPFGVMPELMALADSQISKVFPVCSVEGCFKDASMPQRLRNDKPDSALSPTVIIEGSTDNITYRPVCQKHHVVPDIKEYILSKMNTSKVIQ